MKDATLPPATYTPKVMTLHATAPMTHDPDEAKRLWALHAAAPQLLAACKAAEKVLAAMQETDRGYIVAEELGMIRAAIAKAENGERA